MSIDEIFRTVKFIINKENRGSLRPSDFNLMMKNAQIEFISKRLGNIKMLDDHGLPMFGFRSNRKVSEDLRTLVTDPTTIAVDTYGKFTYPPGYMWPDVVHKLDFTPITVIESDEYPAIKKSAITPPDLNYPVCVMRHPKGFIDPYQIGSFQMSYVKMPADPVWAFSISNNTEVYNAGASVNLELPDRTHPEVIMIALQGIGINLSAMEVTQFASMKESTMS